jgi:hypothetical protein
MGGKGWDDERPEWNADERAFVSAWRRQPKWVSLPFTVWSGGGSHAIEWTQVDRRAGVGGAGGLRSRLVVDGAIGRDRRADQARGEPLRTRATRRRPRLDGRHIWRGRRASRASDADRHLSHRRHRMGSELDPPPTDWAANKTYQPPGAAANPMQAVKIYFQAPYYFIHGTNRPESIGEAASHGCIRMVPEDASARSAHRAGRWASAADHPPLSLKR